ncbi:MAG: glutathione S-transferase family protein [Rhodobacteraceae bacterium]|nr:glutathione S-transferase family protein [Paracoccaceae bacterium]
MSELVLYTNPMSRGRIARWMLEETGQSYRAEILAFGPPMKTPDYLALNPMGKVPTLVHGPAVVTEAAAICAYLADAFPDAGLAPPPQSSARGSYYRWLFFAAGPVEAAVTDVSLNVTTEDPMLQGRLGYGSLGRVLDTLERHFSDGRPYVLGDTFSAADVYLGAAVIWGMMTGGIPERAVFRAYADRLGARPAAVRARELDDALAGHMTAG